ncbi:MAG: hypothetical protein M3494_06470 [Actinomycetota bacterium]|nr:hypothetical protein [Rubrobacter sp.]MDQ3507643.1 hypothetical protein [Actinomycetota bacterium]
MKDAPPKSGASPTPQSEERLEEQNYPVQICEVCETEMFGLHCKIICPNCGYKRDCSDP